MTDLSSAGLPARFFLKADADGVVTATARSNCDQPGMVEIASDLFDRAHGREGRMKWDGAALADYEPLPLPAPAPTAVTRLQGRLALSRAGLLDHAEAAVAAAGGETAIWYADAQIWRREDPHVAAIGAALKLTDAEVDGLFVEASKVV